MGYTRLQGVLSYIQTGLSMEAGRDESECDSWSYITR